MWVNVPGLHNSDDGHWHTKFEHLHPELFIRVHQENWDEPECERWITQIERTLHQYQSSELILIGHSIGCMAIVKWHEKFRHQIKGALLVTPSDAEAKNYPPYIKGFTPIPLETLPFPSIVVASDNDQVTSIERSESFANHWGSQLIVLEGAGHIETASGFGDWPEGLSLIQSLDKGK